jgi:hypothetical protein
VIIRGCFIFFRSIDWSNRKLAAKWIAAAGGGHTWINWRNYLNEFAPQLFGR